MFKFFYAVWQTILSLRKPTETTVIKFPTHVIVKYVPPIKNNEISLAELNESLKNCDETYK